VKLMALPPLSPEQRAAALEKAGRVRKERADLKGRLKQGSVTLPQVLTQAQTDESIGGMRVSALLGALPGVGKARAAQIMDRLGIAEARRVRALSRQHQAALTAEFGPRAADRAPVQQQQQQQQQQQVGLSAEDWDRQR
jgi:hypothetical protein